MCRGFCLVLLITRPAYFCRWSVFTKQTFDMLYEDELEDFFSMDTWQMWLSSSMSVTKPNGDSIRSFSWVLVFCRYFRTRQGRGSRQRHPSAAPQCNGRRKNNGNTAKNRPKVRTPQVTLARAQRGKEGTTALNATNLDLRQQRMAL